MDSRPFHHPHAIWEPDARKRFGEFVRRVSPGTDPVGVMLFGEFLHTSNQLMQVAERNLAEVDLTWAKFRLLMSLQRAEKSDALDGMQPSDLSEMQGISRNAVSALIAGLEQDGLISRKLHGSDRRKFVIRLTPRGRKFVRAKLDDQFQLVSHCFDALSEEERNCLSEFLVRLHRSLAEKSKGDSCKGSFHPRHGEHV